LVEVSPPTWFFLFGATHVLRYTPFPTQHQKELHL